MANAADLLAMDPDELVSQLDETRRELFNLRFQNATGQLDNTARIGAVRRDVARILTVLRQREIEEAEAWQGQVPGAFEAEAGSVAAAEPDEAEDGEEGD